MVEDASLRERDASLREGAVSLRERVKEPPSALLVESYYRGAVARAQRDVFDHEMWVHLAHGLMLERQGILQTGSFATQLG